MAFTGCKNAIKHGFVNHDVELVDDDNTNIAHMRADPNLLTLWAAIHTTVSTLETMTLEQRTTG